MCLIFEILAIISICYNISVLSKIIGMATLLWWTPMGRGMSWRIIRWKQAWIHFCQVIWTILPRGKNKRASKRLAIILNCTGKLSLCFHPSLLKHILGLHTNTENLKKKVAKYCKRAFTLGWDTNVGLLMKSARANRLNELYMRYIKHVTSGHTSVCSTGDCTYAWTD